MMLVKELLLLHRMMRLKYNISGVVGETLHSYYCRLRGGGHIE